MIKEPEVGGEIADRPGINQVWPGIIDTADDDWPDRLHMCPMQHARSKILRPAADRDGRDGS